MGSVNSPTIDVAKKRIRELEKALRTLTKAIDAWDRTDDDLTLIEVNEKVRRVIDRADPA